MQNLKRMESEKCISIGNCPSCKESSTSVKGYKTRVLKHYTIGKIEERLYPVIEFRCKNSVCARTTFSHLVPIAGIEEVIGRSRYTASSKQYVSHKLLKRSQSYNSVKNEIREDFGGKTAVSTLHRWTQNTKLEDVPKDFNAIQVLHTDEKHPSKKKRKCDNKFVIASAGRIDKAGKSTALHANLAESNGKEAIQNHYNELIHKGLDAEKVAMVVTDLLPAYSEVIAQTFPNAVHQCCIFHLIQSFNKELINALSVHRKATFSKGDRKEAHKTAFLLLKGQEKLTPTQREIVFDFCDTHPEIAANYALKEDIRTLYATVNTPAQAYALKDIIVEQYQNTITEPMKKGLELFVTHFDKSIAFLQKGFFLDRTNNDAERMMRAIKRVQQTHYFLRTDQTYMRKIRVVLGIQFPLAA